MRLLSGGVTPKGGSWADLGAGEGAFTLALADLLGSEGLIYAVDKDRRALSEGERRMREGFPAQRVEYLNADFSRPLDLPPLDGIVMANALHFLRRKEETLALVLDRLKPGGRFILIEYNVDQGNPWVPHPLSYPGWERLAEKSGFGKTRLLASVPSRFLHEIYSAVSEKPPSAR
jgi:ubiquinone/menaquinone biosynthesis C-methylase UbiE